MEREIEMEREVDMEREMEMEKVIIFLPIFLINKMIFFLRFST